MMMNLGRVAPGVVVTAATAAAATLLADRLPVELSAVPFALLLGVVLGNLLPRDQLAAGTTIIARHVLRIGIVLLGARLSLGDVAQLGSVAILLAIGSITLGLAAAAFIGTRLGCGRELVALLGVGSAICGNTAIMATAPALHARSRDVALAVSTITICGTVGLLLFPWIGNLIGMSDTAFGVWSGLAIQDTSQVVAAGSAYSEPARDVATVVKLVRNAAMAVVIPGVAWWTHRESTDATGIMQTARSAFPGFIVAFLAMVALRSLGVINEAAADVLSDLADIAILLAIAALGLGIAVRELTRTSWRALVTGAAAALLLAVAGFALANLAVRWLA